METKKSLFIGLLIALHMLLAPQTNAQEKIFYGAEDGTINNCVSSCTSGDGDCFIIAVSGVGTLNTTTNGLTRLCFSITSTRPQDYDIVLKAPDGTTASIVNDAGSSTKNYNNGICFTDFGPTDNLVSFPGTIEEGNYIPNATFSATFNTPALNANGNWQLCIRDDNSGGTNGTINFASLTFGKVVPETNPSGTTCANAVVVNPPFFRTNIDVGASTDAYDSGCSGIISGDDYVLEYTPASNTFLSLTANYDATSNGPSVAIFDGCPDTSPSCVASDKMGSFDTYIRLTGVPLTGGTTYYIVCSSDFSSTSENLDLEILVGASGDAGCSTATVINSIYPIMGNNIIVPNTNGSEAPNLTTEMACNGATNNFSYYIFNTSSTGTAVNLGIFDISCGAGASGLQVSLFQSSTPCITGSWGAAIYCESSVLNSDLYYNWTGLLPATDYYVVIDGVAGDDCTWKMRMSGDFEVTLLPVELLDFSGKEKQRENVLEWTTATELNNDYFSVERSSDGLHFEEIGTVKGAGTAQQLNRYEFLDHTPFQGLNYYRLKQVDFNGKSSYSRIISLQTQSPTAHIYPNPVNVNGALTVQAESPITAIYLHDMQGQLLQKIHGNGVAVALEINALPKRGVYLLTVVYAHHQDALRLIVR